MTSIRWVHTCPGADCRCLFNIGNDVAYILNAYRQTDQVRSDSRFAQLLVGELAVSMAGGMQYAGTCVGHMGYDADEFQPVHKFYRFFTGSVQAESDDTA